VQFHIHMDDQVPKHIDIVPGGLLGQDGYCFDLLSSDSEEVDYVAQRIQEAHAAAIS